MKATKLVKNSIVNHHAINTVDTRTREEIISASLYIGEKCIRQFTIEPATMLDLVNFFTFKINEGLMNSNKIVPLKPENDNTDRNKKQEIERLIKRKSVVARAHDNTIAFIGQDRYLPMIPSYIESIPNGYEEGTYLAVDLGGTNVRILSVTLNGNGSLSNNISISQVKEPISQELKAGTGNDLFLHIAKLIKSHMLGNKMSVSKEEKTYKLGFTFSFEIIPTSVVEASIQSWSKGFSCEDSVGHNPVSILSEKLIEIGVTSVKIVALLNDSVGTLMYGSYINHGVDIGLILGTGYNIAYMEDSENITKLSKEDRYMYKRMAINTEIGSTCLIDKHSNLNHIWTSYDARLDAISNNVSQHLYEKMISGHYIGEILRIVLTDVFFDLLPWGPSSYDCENTVSYRVNRQYNNGEDWSILKPYSINAMQMSQMETDTSPNRNDVEKILGFFSITGTSLEQRIMVSDLCYAISTRSATLAAVAIAAFVRRLGFPERKQGVKIVVDGSLFKFYPSYRERVDKTLNTIFGAKSNEITFALASDGSGVGAAIIASML